MGDYVPSPRQKYRFMLVDGIEKALNYLTQERPKAMWLQLRGMVMLLSRYMSDDVRERVLKLIEEVNRTKKEIEDNAKLSTAEKEARLNKLYEEKGMELYDYLSWVVTHSPVIGMDIEGAILVDVESVEDLKRLGEEMRRMHKVELDDSPGPVKD